MTTYGVNLGGWLVLERWMTPSLFAGTSAVDEYGLAWQLVGQTDDRIGRHRDTFVTEDDFAWLAAQGITSVRLPVGYWVFGGQAPYAAAVEHVDRAFAWAATHGISVLLCLHGAPGSQNGNDHSGRSGRIGWHTRAEHAEQSLDVVGRLAQRYGDHPALLGLELLNEPSWRLPYRALWRYYRRAYDVVRRHAGPDAWVVFNPFFLPERWRWALRGPAYAHVLLDVHLYQCFSRRDRGRPVAGHLRKVRGGSRRLISRLAARHPVVVGEWSLALDAASLAGLDDAGQEQAYRDFADAQLSTYAGVAAWYFWSYRTEGGGSWSFRSCVETGRLRLPVSPQA